MSVGVLEIILVCTDLEVSMPVPSNGDPVISAGLLTVHFLKCVLMLLLCENLSPQFGQEYGFVPV